MKKLFIAIAALATTLVATPVLAQDFTGPRVEVNASVTDVTKARNTNDITYGGAVGYDIPLGSKITFGVEASSDNPFASDRTIGAAARLGYVVNNRVLVFGKAGYENYKSIDLKNRRFTADGLRLGGGVEVNLTNNSYVKLEGRYTDFNRGVGRVGALAGIGLRF